MSITGGNSEMSRFISVERSCNISLADEQHHIIPKHRKES